jgi:hypothetical protein
MSFTVEDFHDLIELLASTPSGVLSCGVTCSPTT